MGPTASLLGAQATIGSTAHQAKGWYLGCSFSCSLLPRLMKVNSSAVFRSGQRREQKVAQSSTATERIDLDFTGPPFCRLVTTRKAIR